MRKQIRRIRITLPWLAIVAPVTFAALVWVPACCLALP